MGKKFYCEYCDRAFRDTAADRKKHRQTAAHQAAKLDYEVGLLRRFHDQFGPSRLMSMLSPEEHRILVEVLAKPIACKFHFALSHPQQQQQLCKHGDRCKNSHWLNQEQLTQHRETFLNRFSATTPASLSSLTGSHPSGGPPSPPPPLSKRQLKKEIYQSVWLESQFGIDTRCNELVEELRLRNQ